MTVTESIEALEKEWLLAGGALGQLRVGQFDKTSLTRLATTLEAMPKVGDVSHARLIALSWFIPIFMTWQRERCLDHGVSPAEFDLNLNAITRILEDRLGVP